MISIYMLSFYSLKKGNLHIQLNSTSSTMCVKIIFCSVFYSLLNWYRQESCVLSG